jgi:hypothetical protein
MEPQQALEVKDEETSEYATVTGGAIDFHCVYSDCKRSGTELCARVIHSTIRGQLAW